MGCQWGRAFPETGTAPLLCIERPQMIQCENKSCGRTLQDGDTAYVQTRRVITVSGNRAITKDVEVVVCVECAG